MKRPIAECLTIALKPGSEVERRQLEHEAWQILRHKQGYITHRIYEDLADPHRRLIYSEWESKKAVDGARQYLQGTPLMRRSRNTLAGPPQRTVVELVGAITSTKGLDLPEHAVAILALGHLAEGQSAAESAHDQFWKVLSKEPGYLTHVRFRGFDNVALVGSLSHWANDNAWETALALGNAQAPAFSPGEASTARYRALRD